MKRILFIVLFLMVCSNGQGAENMKITSPDISPGDYIPSKFTCQSRNVSPRLEFVDVPDKTKSLALVVHDPDAPLKDWVHWVVFNIPPDKFEVDEGIAPGVEGVNDSGKVRWDGPCPPSGTHHYVFEAYALDVKLDLKEGATRAELDKAMEGHVLNKAELVALYEKF
jgi:Raf kinase inhibitor-like YbhB/YbcL family protein